MLISDAPSTLVGCFSGFSGFSFFGRSGCFSSHSLMLSAVYGTSSGKPCCSANHFAASPTSSTCGVFSMTRFASAAGCLMCSTHATPPQARVECQPAEPVRQAAEPHRVADGSVVLHRLRPGEGRVEGEVALRQSLHR